MAHTCTTAHRPHTRTPPIAAAAPSTIRLHCRQPSNVRIARTRARWRETSSAWRAFRHSRAVRTHRRTSRPARLLMKAVSPVRRKPDATNSITLASCHVPHARRTSRAPPCQYRVTTSFRTRASSRCRRQ